VVAASRSGAAESTAWDLSNWLSMEALDQLFTDVQAVVHAGASVQSIGFVDRANMFDVNVRSCLNLGEWAISRNIPLLYISGAIVYEDPFAPLQAESSPVGGHRLGGFYGFSKLLGEDGLIRLRRQGLNLCVLRPSSIYGFGIDADKMVPRFLGVAAKGGVIKLSQPVNDRVDLINAADVSAAVMAALEHNCWETLNVSSGRPVSIMELAEACLNIAGKGNIEIRDNQQSNHKERVKYSLDITRAKKEIHWQPRIDIAKGLNMLMTQNCVDTSQA